jgi:hypothetical protein
MVAAEGPSMTGAITPHADADSSGRKFQLLLLRRCSIGGGLPHPQSLSRRERDAVFYSRESGFLLLIERDALDERTLAVHKKLPH